MENHYQILGVPREATTAEIKKAFRERAKKNHPDVATDVSLDAAQEEMRKLIAAYEILSNPERRHEYDRAYGRFVHPSEFDYRNFLWERRNEPEFGAKLIFYDFLHLEDDEALSIWEALGGLDFTLDRYLDREDWMDCTFILAEELYKRDRSYESFILLIDLVREENLSVARIPARPWRTRRRGNCRRNPGGSGRKRRCAAARLFQRGAQILSASRSRIPRKRESRHHGR